LQRPLFLDGLQAPFQEIDLHRLLAHLPLQFGDLAFAPAPLPLARKGIARTLPELTPPAMQYVGVDLQAARYFRDRNPRFQPPYGGQLKLASKRPP
jgi:hypothetical protein